MVSLSIRTARKAIDDPQTAIQAIRAQVRKYRLNYEKERVARIRHLAHLIGKPAKRIRAFETELQQSAFAADYRDRFDRLSAAGLQNQTSSHFDSVTMYCLVRALAPETVVATGARYGAFDAHIAAALDANEKGTVYSVDLPASSETGPAHPEARDDVFGFGYLIPPSLRSRWELSLGDVRDDLDDLLSRVGPVDLFVHDSNHTPDHMRFEFSTALPHLRTGGVLTGHDVLLSPTLERIASTRGDSYIQIGNVGVMQTA
jgi:predicted O-methyltransferase YrrM